MTAPACTATRTVLMYAQDHQGLGHVTRTLTVARHVLACHPDCVAYIATKSPLTGFAVPERCDYIKLPTLLTPGGLERSEGDEEAAKQHFRTIRGDILRDAALGLAPDLVVVDHEPLGAKGEFREGLYALKARSSRTRFVFGLRDIMDDPDRIRADWGSMGVYDAFQDVYDGIAVYGARELYDVAAAYDIPPSVQPKLQYCGYIVRDPPRVDPAAVRAEYGVPAGRPLLLATVGSGSDGYPVLEAARAAAAQLRTRWPDLVVILVTGPFMPAGERAALERHATPACRVLGRVDTFPLMRAADAIVSMGGYNSLCEALVSARPLVIVPRATHKVEQRIRAETLAARGLARWIHPRELTGTRLADAVAWALTRDPRSHAQLVRSVIPSFDGAARLTAYLSRWLDGA